MKKFWARALPAHRGLGAMLCAALLLLSGCTAQPATVEESPTQTLLHATATPAPTLNNAPAAVYTNVLTDQHAVSLILEGFVDDTVMQSVLDTLTGAKVPAVFFISGVAADESSGAVRNIAKAGFVIGNYGLNAEKNMQDNDIPTNIHQFQRAQELIAQAAGVVPTLFRCNGSVYTTEVLQAAAYVGLQAGVQPNLYLNHSSFKQYSDAQTYVQKLGRGSIITIKLGQALDADEYLGTDYNMDYLAIDPPPMLSDKMEDTLSTEYANDVNVVQWLLQALEEEGYVVLAPEALQAQRINMFDRPATLSEEQTALVNADAYSLPVTAQALPNPVPVPAASTTATPDPSLSPSPDATVAPADDSLANGVVFVGDSVTQGLQSYVGWRRESNGGFLGSAQFLTSTNFSVGMALMKLSDTSIHPMLNGEKVTIPDALYAMKAKTVFLMPGQADIQGYTIGQFLQNLKLMIYEIRQKNPGILIGLQSVPPGAASRYSAPTNTRIFRYNLAMYQLCLQYGIPFADVAFSLRDENGCLPDSLCVDLETYGYHLNDAGCDAWIATLRTLTSD